jgi:hypothetical protein
VWGTVARRSGRIPFWRHGGLGLKIPGARPDLSSIAHMPVSRTNRSMNDIPKYLALFENFQPFSGYVPKGFLADFLGCLTDANFRTMWGANPVTAGGVGVTTECPSVTWGETFFEAVDWLEAAREARESYTMFTLGACYGSQAVGAYKAFQRLNPMPAKLVAVEADPENFCWLQKNFRDNGINPDKHWLLQCALSDSTKPVLFPVGSPGSGANNCHATNHQSSRVQYAQRPQTPPLVSALAPLLDGREIC